MIPKLILAWIIAWMLVDGGSTELCAAEVTIAIQSQVMTPGMALDPEKADIQRGDTVVWLNLSGHGIKIIPDWEETEALPPYIQPGGKVRLRLDRGGTYRYSVFTATDRFEEDRVPAKLSGVIIVHPS